METDWLYRINVIIPITEIENKNALWTVIAPNGDAEAQSFGVPSLSATGKEPATHSAISTAANSDMRIFIEDIFTDELSDAVVSVQDYRENNFHELVSDNGLKTVEEEIL